MADTVDYAKCRKSCLYKNIFQNCPEVDGPSEEVGPNGHIASSEKPARHA